MKNHLFSETSQGLNLVAIGGGNGLSMLLSGLKNFVDAGKSNSVWLKKLSGIVAVSDDGGSCGRLVTNSDAAARRYSRLYGRAVGRFAFAFKTFPASFQRRR